MRPRTLTVLAAVGLAVAAPVGLGIPSSVTSIGTVAVPAATLGTGSKTCTAKRGASCKGVKHHRANLAGRDLRGARFEKAELHYSDFREADLRGAHFEGAKLRGVDFSGARLKGAHFEAPKRAGKGANQAQPAPSCNPKCKGADLTSANFTTAGLANANFTSAYLPSANFTSADLTDAYFIGANLTGALWNDTTCPDGTVHNTGC